MKKPCDRRASSASHPHTPIPLTDLAPDETAVVCSLSNGDSMRRRLLDLGLTEGTAIRCVGRSPAGDPAAYAIRGAIIALRRKDSRAILVRRCSGRNTVWD